MTAGFLVAPREGDSVWSIGGRFTRKVGGSDSGGRLSILEAVVTRTAEPRRHIHHREDEAFYILSGELLIECEGEAAPHRVPAGGFFFGARGRRHSIRNVGDQPARVLVLAAPSCGLDQMFAELDAATAGGVPDIGALAAICAKYGVAIEPPTT